VTLNRTYILWRVIRILAVAAWFTGPGIPVYAVDSLRDQIVAAQTSGHYAEAAQLYLQLIASGSDGPAIRSNCGVMLHLAGNNREALEQFRIALRQEPDLPAPNLFAGIAEFELGEFNAALPYLNKAQQLDPGRPAPLLALAKVYVALRDYQRANELYEKAVTLDARLAEAWYGLGVTSRSLAEQLLNQTARQGEIKSAAKNEKIQQLLNSAVQALTRAVELDPNSARAHLLMAESLADAGKPLEAVSEFNAAIKLDPRLDAAYLGLATNYWKQHQFDQALPLLKDLLRKSPNDPEINAMIADLLEHNGDVANAEQHARIALAANPSLIQTHVVLARIYLGRQQPKLAMTELRKIIPADPDGNYHYLLYRACRQAGDERGAKEALAEFRQIRYAARKP
jgi:tetratricopeptide (TPR) repeat protein